MTITVSPTILDTIPADEIEPEMALLFSGVESFVIDCRKAGQTVGLWLRNLATGETSRVDLDATETVAVTWL